MEPSSNYCVAGESARLDAIAIVVGYKTFRCPADSSLGIFFVCFRSILVVIDSDVELHGVEVVEAAATVWHFTIISIAILLYACEPRLRPIEILIIVGCLYHRLCNETRDIVQFLLRVITLNLHTGSVGIKLRQTEFCGIGIKIMRPGVYRPLRIPHPRIELHAVAVARRLCHHCGEKHSEERDDTQNPSRQGMSFLRHGYAAAKRLLFFLHKQITEFCL